MMVSRDNPNQFDAVFASADGPEALVTNEEELREVLKVLPSIRSGQTVSLYRNPKNYIRATCRGELWSAVARRGGWWTLASFTAEITSEYSDHQVRESRAAGSLRKRVAFMIASPAPEHALSAVQVKTIFVEYLLGMRFSIPQSGA